MLVKCLMSMGGWWKPLEMTGIEAVKEESLFSIASLIIRDDVIMESNFLTHLSHKYPILDSSGTVGGIRISGESELQVHYHQKYISLFIIIKYL